MRNVVLPIIAIGLLLLAFGGGGGILPNPSPVPVSSAKVLVLYESDELGTMDEDQRSVIIGFQSRAGLYDTVTANGAEVRTYDDDVNTANLDEEWQKMVAIEHSTLPWIVIATPRGGTSEPLPETEEATKALLEAEL